MKKILDDSEVEEIDLFVLSRVKDLVFGEHASVFTGSGFDFSGLREWQSGDRPASIDWGHSTHTGFSPLIVKEFVEEKSINVLIAADNSLSALCGANGATISEIIARAIATIGFSAVIFQDKVGLVTFGEDFLYESPRGGRSQVFRILEIYQSQENYSEKINQKGATLPERISGNLARTSLVPVISDFLFPDAKNTLKELTALNQTHDVFIIMVDASFAFNLPPSHSGWIECVDVENGKKMLLSEKEFKKMAERVKTYQEDVERFAKKEGFDVLSVGNDKNIFQDSILNFFAERRLKRK